MFQGKIISLVFATYKEKSSIRKVIEDFYNTGLVDEVIVVNNNAEEGTKKEVSKTPARMVHEPNQGYGYAFRRGILEAKGDYIVLCEPDGSFSASDLPRFLEKAESCPVVLGSRVSRDSAMSPIRGWANIIVAKTIQILFRTSPLSDIGCTYKLFYRETLREIEKLCETKNYLFATELILVAAAKKISLAEIPVIFSERTGKSSIVTSPQKLVFFGAYIFLFIFKFWLHRRKLSDGI